MSDITPNFPGYEDFLRDLKQRIQTAQVKAALAANSELIMLYWQIGQQITDRQHHHGWGEKVLDRIAADLKASFESIEGFSRRSLYRMRAFFQAYSDLPEFVSQVATQIPWFHNVVIIEEIAKVRKKTRIWY